MHGSLGSVDLRQPRIQGGKALIFAWLVEGIAVFMGLVLTVFAGIEGSDGGAPAIVISMLPFVALSVIELTKIPLVSLAFQVQSAIWRFLAIVALIFVTAATFENFVFGFERGFNERIRTVELADQAVQSHVSARELAEARIPHLIAAQNDIATRLEALRREVDGIRGQAQADITDARENVTSEEYRSERMALERELVALGPRQEAEVNRERARCRAMPESRCNVAYILGNYQRQRDALSARITSSIERQREQEAAVSTEVANARQRRDAELIQKDRERASLQAELAVVRQQLSEVQSARLQGVDSVAQAEARRDEMIERSQLHRLSMVLFGRQDRETLEQTKRLFVISLAGIVAAVGSFLAAMHYAAQAAQARRRRPLIYAIRGYLARRRRRLSPWVNIREELRQRNGIARNLRGWLARRRRAKLPVVVKEIIKEVPQDRIKLVFLPLNATEDEIAESRREAMRNAV